MLFYVPPILPVLGYVEDNVYDVDADEYFPSLEKARAPISYMASLFSAGNEEHVRSSYKKLLAVRTYRRAMQVDDMDAAEVEKLLEATGLTAEACEEIFRLTSLPTFEERFVIPPMHREYAIELMGDPYEFKAETGVGLINKPKRGP